MDGLDDIEKDGTKAAETFVLSITPQILKRLQSAMKSVYLAGYRAGALRSRKTHLTLAAMEESKKETKQ